MIKIYCWLIFRRVGETYLFAEPLGKEYKKNEAVSKVKKHGQGNC